MADSAKNKKAAALERIKALREGRASNRTGTPQPGPGAEGAAPPKNAPRQESTGHRPQGG